MFSLVHYIHKDVERKIMECSFGPLSDSSLVRVAKKKKKKLQTEGNTPIFIKLIGPVMTTYKPNKGYRTIMLITGSLSGTYV